MASGLKSSAARLSKPARSIPKLNPPQPQNRSKKVIYCNNIERLTGIKLFLNSRRYSLPVSVLREGAKLLKQANPEVGDDAICRKAVLLA
jgi:hypothetical protein